MRLKLNIWQINFITTFYYISLEYRNSIKFFKIYEYDQNISKYLNLNIDYLINLWLTHSLGRFCPVFSLFQIF